MVIDGAMGLFARYPVDEVTVQDIASAIEMTPAAVYYHFASKEQILTEGMEQFHDELLEVIADLQPPDDVPPSLRALVLDVIAWVDEHRAPATVYFVNSVGLNLVVEALRRESRAELVGALRGLVRAVRADLTAAEAAVIAVALVSLLETAFASMLIDDAVYTGLGSSRFGETVATFAERIVGLPAGG